MKDIVTPVAPEEVRNVVRKCLENAALVNYTRVSEYAKIEGETCKRFHFIVCFYGYQFNIHFYAKQLHHDIKTCLKCICH